MEPFHNHTVPAMLARFIPWKLMVGRTFILGWHVFSGELLNLQGMQCIPCNLSFVCWVFNQAPVQHFRGFIPTHTYIYIYVTVYLHVRTLFQINKTQLHVKLFQPQLHFLAWIFLVRLNQKLTICIYRQPDFHAYTNPPSLGKTSLPHRFYLTELRTALTLKLCRALRDQWPGIWGESSVEATCKTIEWVLGGNRSLTTGSGFKRILKKHKEIKAKNRTLKFKQWKRQRIWTPQHQPPSTDSINQDVKNIWQIIATSSKVNSK